MNVLVLNCGSSSVKFRLVAIGDGERPLAAGRIERLGPDAVLHLAAEAAPPRVGPVRAPDHATAVRHVLALVRSLRAGGDVVPVHAVGHRVVHGGDRFVAPTVIDDTVVRALSELVALAPLHNGPSLAGIRACVEALGPGTPMVAVFDTAFHATLPERARRYAIPWELAERHAIRRYGFHGLAYRSVLARYCARGAIAPERATLVALHLGSGCSAAAIRNGRSVDTSMGLTPLEGLVMGTRSGDVDAALVARLAEAEGVSASEVERWLNERSGLLGLAGSSDTRDVLARAARDPRAALALDLFCYRARKYVGAYLAALGGADAVVFSGGIGEHEPEIRSRICEGMAWCGLELDPARNDATVGADGLISRDGARLRALVIASDEESVIARDTAERLARAA